MTPTTEKLVENHLRWFGHVQSRPIDVSVKRVDQTTWSPIKRGKERPRQTLDEFIEQDPLVNSIAKELATDRAH